MAKNKVILGQLSGSAVFLNPVCMIVTKMHFKEPDEGIIISKETIHTWEFVTEEAIKDAFAGKSDCALEGMTEEYGQELMAEKLRKERQEQRAKREEYRRRQEERFEKQMEALKNKFGNN